MDVVSTSGNGTQFGPLIYLSSVYMFLASVCCTIGRCSAFQISLYTFSNFCLLIFVINIFVCLLSWLLCCFCLLFSYTSAASVMLLPYYYHHHYQQHCHIVVAYNMETPIITFTVVLPLLRYQCSPCGKNDCNNGNNNWASSSLPSPTSSLLYLLSLLQCKLNITYLYIFFIYILTFCFATSAALSLLSHSKLAP